MGKEALDNVNDALSLLARSRSFDYKKSCLPVCIAALGGRVQMEDIIRANEWSIGYAWKSGVSGFIESRGLKSSFQFLISSGLPAERADHIINDPKEFVRSCTGKSFPENVVGTLILFGGTCDNPGHSVAIINGHNLQRDKRRFLNNNKLHVCFDPGKPKGYGLLSLQEISEMVRDELAGGMDVELHIVTNGKR